MRPRPAPLPESVPRPPLDADDELTALLADLLERAWRRRHAGESATAATEEPAS